MAYLAEAHTDCILLIIYWQAHAQAMGALVESSCGRVPQAGYFSQ